LVCLTDRESITSHQAVQDSNLALNYADYQNTAMVWLAFIIQIRPTKQSNVAQRGQLVRSEWGKISS